MFERFTSNAISVIMFAQEEARRLGHNRVGSEQILLGLVRERGQAGKLLRSNGLKLDEARKTVESLIGRGSAKISVEIPFSSEAKRILERSSVHASELKSSRIDSTNLLGAILGEENSMAARVLRDCGVNFVALSAKLAEHSTQVFVSDHDSKNAFQSKNKPGQIGINRRHLWILTLFCFVCIYCLYFLLTPLIFK